MKKIFYLVGARPQFMQAAMISKAFTKYKDIDFQIIHSGQHFDDKMNKIFFEELEIPKPYENLHINSLPHGAMVGKIMEEFEALCLKEKPDLIIVDGDTNSTIAGALVAAKSKIKSLHIESGLRSHDINMPEEVNRIVADNCCTKLFCPTGTAFNNLKISNLEYKAEIVGDVLYDAFCYYQQKSKGKAEAILKSSALNSKAFVLLTLHREENLENEEKLKNIFFELEKLQKSILFPLHPRTKKVIESYGIIFSDKFKTIDPVSYMEMIDLESRASYIITDSGGVQREAYWSQKPVFILRDTTEWVEQLSTGWAYLIKEEELSKLSEIVKKVLNNVDDTKYEYLYGKGNAAELISKSAEEMFE